MLGKERYSSMIKIIGENIGPFANLDLELNRLNLIFGPVGSGKTYLFRILSLINIARSFTETGLISESIETQFSRLLLMDEGLKFEAKLGEEFVKGQATNILLKKGSNKGKLQLIMNNREMKLLISKDSKEEKKKIVFEGDLKLLDDVIYIHIPQERPHSELSTYMNAMIREYLELMDRYGDITHDMLLYKLIYDQGLNPILSAFIINIIAAIGHVMSKIKENVYEVKIEGALGRTLKIYWDRIEKRLVFKDQELNVVINMPSRLRIPFGVLEAGSIKMILDGIIYFRSLERELIPIILTIDEFGEHCDPVLVQKIIDRIFSTTFTINKLYTVIITHNPDILTRSLKLLERKVKEDKGIIKYVNIHQFMWNPEIKSVEVYTIGLDIKDGYVVPKEPIKIFDEAFTYMHT